MNSKDKSVTLDADTLEALRGYLAFIDTRAEALALPDVEPAQRAASLHDIRMATAAARALFAGRRSPVVLVVDDHPPIHQLARRILEPEGYVVLSAPDGPAALVLLASTSVSVVLSDIHMPGPSGLWLAERIRDGYPATAIVFATSDNTLSPTDTVREGVTGYVLKPFRRELLLSAVQDGVRWAQSQRDRSSS
jgi:CheY-like chemotaxis protein